MADVFAAVFGFALSDNHSGPRRSPSTESPLLIEEPSIEVGHPTFQQLDLLEPWFIYAAPRQDGFTGCSWVAMATRAAARVIKGPGEAGNGRRLRTSSGTSLWKGGPWKNHLFLDLCDHPPHR